MSVLGNDLADLIPAACGGNRRALARLLTLVERGGPAARAVMTGLGPTDPVATVGVTGSPGAGKSTLVSAWCTDLRRRFDALAVLAIDPSSPFTGGAILGDRVRMSAHATDPDVFIRSMATRGHLGGLSAAATDAVAVLGATGRDLVVIETVGVGQVEVEITGAADTTVVVVNPGWGDAVQANKAGLMEVADIFVINKADREGAGDTRRDLEQMLDLAGHPLWRPPVVSTVATTGEGIEELTRALLAHREYLDVSGEGERRRTERRERRLRDALGELIAHEVEDLLSGPAATELATAVRRGDTDPVAAAEQLWGARGGVTPPHGR